MTNLPATLTFEATEISIIDRDGHPWLTFTDLTKALYGLKGSDRSDRPFENALRATRRLFAENEDEFAERDTALITLPTPGGPQEMRVFSARGAQMFSFFAKTPKAKAFRRWVLDILDGLDRPPTITDRPLYILLDKQLVPILMIDNRRYVPWEAFLQSCVTTKSKSRYRNTVEAVAETLSPLKVPVTDTPLGPAAWVFDPHDALLHFKFPDAMMRKNLMTLVMKLVETPVVAYQPSRALVAY